MSEELWGPWIEHDGKGCPCVGSYVAVELVTNRIGETRITEAVATGGQSWLWMIHRAPPNVWQRIIRYRIRKPRGLTILEELLESLPAPTSPKVDA